MHQKTPLRVGKGLPRLALCAVLLAALALSGCGSRQTHEEYLIPKGPAVGFESPEFFTEHLAPRNQDLQSWREMAPTVRKSLRYVKSKPAGAVAIDRPGLRLTWADMERTLLRLQELLPRLDAEPQLFLQNFQWVEVPSGIAYSGYYEPRVKASRTRKPGYEQDIYALPPDMKQHQRRHNAVLSRRGNDDGQKHTVKRHAQRTDDPQRQGVACHDAQRRADRPRRGCQQDRTVGVAGV